MPISFEQNMENLFFLFDWTIQIRFENIYTGVIVVPQARVPEQTEYAVVLNY